MIVKHVVHEANLAWAVAGAAKPYLNAVERNAVFVAIGAGETFPAIRGLLRSVEIKRIPLELNLLQQCRMWLRGYDGHDDERYLRRLIEERLIPYAIGVLETMRVSVRRRSSPSPASVRAATQSPRDSQSLHLACHSRAIQIRHAGSVRTPRRA
jgi:hypothetical protein